MLGNDTLYGGSGSDELHGESGDDILYGGNGADTLYGGNGVDTLDGGNGIDTANYAYATEGVTVELTTVTIFGTLEGYGTAAVGTNGSDTDTLWNIENITGTDYNDTITGNSFANVLDGGLGDDTLDGGAGDDTLIGGSGFDMLLGGEGTDTADYSYAEAGVTVKLNYTHATIGTYGGATVGTDDTDGDFLYGVENIIGTDYNDSIIGNSADNTFYGGKGDDVLKGGNGADTLSGGVGADTLTGGNGSDTFVFDTFDGSIDTITDFSASEFDIIEIDSSALMDYFNLGSLSASDITTVTDANGLSLQVNGTTFAYLEGALSFDASADLTLV